MFKKFGSAINALTSRLSWRALGTKRALSIAGLIAAITFGTLQVLRPPVPPTVSVVVAAKDLAIGTEVGSSDVRTIEVPPGAVPPSALLERHAVIDQTLIAPVSEGLMFTAAALHSAGHYDAAPAGTVATPVRFPDAQLVKLLQPGDRINVFVTGHSSAEIKKAEVVARRALVLAIPASEGSESGLLSAPSTSSGNIVILAVPEDQATSLAAASQLGTLSIALVQ